jgi:hypothetical protein
MQASWTILKNLEVSHPQSDQEASLSLGIGSGTVRQASDADTDGHHTHPGLSVFAWTGVGRIKFTHQV